MSEDFTEFVQRTQPDAFRLALALCAGDPHEAADLHQAALERLWSRWRRLQMDNPGAYLRAVIVRTHATRRRRLFTSREIPADVVPDAIRPGAQDARTDALALTAALGLLPLRQRQAVVLRYLEDLPIAEVADLMSCTTGTVKRAAHDGLRALRSRLHAEYQPHEVTDA